MRSKLVTVGGGLLAAVVVGVGAGAAGAQAADPPGNNGTVKIDGVELDSHPDNEPHVGCEFQVDFYGFDQGDLDATVTFEAHPPTPPTGVEELLTDEVAIGEDAAGGGTDLDADETYDLTEALAGIEPHPVQGWHVKLTVHAEGSQGADTKFKVFWVTGCGDETPPTTAPPTSTTTPGSPTTTTPDDGPGRPDSPGRPDRPGRPDDTPPPPPAVAVVAPPDFVG